MRPPHASRPFASSSQGGYALLLVMAIVGLALGIALWGYNLGTRNQAAESQLSVIKHQLQLTGQSQIRLFDQYVKAGWVKANCAGKGLIPTAEAPEVVLRAHAGSGFRFTSCDPKTLRSNKANAILSPTGVPEANCVKIPTQVEVVEANWEDRYVVVNAKTKLDSTHPLLGNIEASNVKARIELPPPPVPTFGLLVNDLHCGMCHVKVNGDVASTKAVTPFHEWSDQSGKIKWPALIAGDWWANKAWNPAPRKQYIDIQFTGGKVHEFYSGPKLPGRTVGTGSSKKFVAEFPRIDHTKLANFTNPDPFGCEKRKLNVLSGNTVLLGTQDEPIALTGDIHVKGDLVISGWYQGVGSIYVDGNVYIPFDLKAMRSIFPYPTDVEAAKKVAKDSMKGKKHDALAIATARSIIIGEFEHPSGQKSKSVWFNSMTPKDKQGDKIGVRDIDKWFKGGRQGYTALFGRAFNCQTGSSATGELGSINIIEAYLYAENTIGGLARKNSFSINGGIIADNFHVVSNAHYCQDGIHPVHKQSMRWSYVNYDWRMRFGLPLLDRFSEYFSRE